MKVVIYRATQTTQSTTQSAAQTTQSTTQTTQLEKKNSADALPEIKIKILNAVKDRPEMSQMPTWWKGHNIIHFAANKKHIGLYPGPEAVAQFAEKLDQAGCKYSKGSI